MKSLEITSYIGCPNHCNYCPQDTLMNAYSGKKTMSLTDFSKILSNTPKNVRLDFSGFSEIFCHDLGVTMIKAAYDKGFKVVLYTTLIGFDSMAMEILRGVKFDDLCFHQYPGYDIRWFEKKREIFEENIQKGRTAVITKENLWSRAGNVFDRNTEYGKFHCLFAGKLFDHNVVLPNGDVYLCCQDYSLRHRIGNLYETNFDSLNRLDLIRKSDEVDSDCICRVCELMQKE